MTSYEWLIDVAVFLGSLLVVAGALLAFELKYRFDAWLERLEARDEEDVRRRAGLPVDEPPPRVD